MKLRIRVVEEAEFDEAKRDGRLLIQLYYHHYNPRHGIPVVGVLEYESGEGSAEGLSWTPVEITW